MQSATNPANILGKNFLALKCNINKIIKHKIIITNETNTINFAGNKFNFII